MFYRRCGRFSVLHFVLFILGLKAARRAAWTEEERQAFRTKAKRFRSKLRDAYSVWDEEEGASSGNDTTTV